MSEYEIDHIATIRKILIEKSKASSEFDHDLFSQKVDRLVFESLQSP
jgi:hypothetical protein